jgi:hypothetical protein
VAGIGFDFWDLNLPGGLLAEYRVNRFLIETLAPASYAFDGWPDACWALVTIAEGSEPTAELRRATYDAQAAAEEVSARGLPSDVYRAATIRTGRFVR